MPFMFSDLQFYFYISSERLSTE